MAEQTYNVISLDDGSITVDAPSSVFPEKGYFTMYDSSAVAKGMCLPNMRRKLARGTCRCKCRACVRGRTSCFYRCCR